MRTLTRAVITMAAVAGAVTATGTPVVAAPANQATAVTSTTSDWVIGIGYGDTANTAVDAAYQQASFRAIVFGFSPTYDCSVADSQVEKVSANRYRGQVLLLCYR